MFPVVVAKQQKHNKTKQKNTTHIVLLSILLLGEWLDILWHILVHKKCYFFLLSEKSKWWYNAHYVMMSSHSV